MWKVCSVWLEKAVMLAGTLEIASSRLRAVTITVSTWSGAAAAAGAVCARAPGAQATKATIDAPPRSAAIEARAR